MENKDFSVNNTEAVLSDETYAKLPALKDADAKTVAEAIAEVLENRKATDVKVIYVRERTSLTSYFVLATGQSSTHVRALAGEVEHKMELRALPAFGVEGRDNDAWIAMDYSDVIVHIFNRESRAFYNLDKLYS
ncbi:iojap-like protein [Clostridium sp. CAG:448]|nr:iojap-like protein [Clostridium sp. CAG:448]